MKSTIQEKAKLKYYQDRKIESLFCDIYYFPINVLRFLKRQRQKRTFIKGCTEIEVLREEIDKIDNIKKIGNISKKQAIELSKMLDNELKEWLVNNNLLKEFNNNIRLIDFKYIPEDKKLNLLNKLNFIKE